jgi:hypothetical protein
VSLVDVPQGDLELIDFALQAIADVRSCFAELSKLPQNNSLDLPNRHGKFDVALGQLSIVIFDRFDVILVAPFGGVSERGVVNYSPQ